jgi:beta-glucosidase/6-phospho-beta-glucosidase/beta-galactosidase
MSRLSTLVVALSLASALACKSSDTTPPPVGDAGGDAGPSEVAFPSGFLWGTATAGFQVEKGDSHTDWAHWVAINGKIKGGDNPDVGGPDALAHVDGDVAMMQSEKHNAYRFSIEWARLFPTRAAFTALTPDAAGLAAYDGEIAKLRAAGIAPMVTLQHFSLPDWESDVSKPTQPQGWENAVTVTDFEAFCKWAGGHFGKDVDWWITINEPLNMLLGGYLQGSFPPGLVLNEDRAFAAGRNEIRAHAKCYDALHATDTVDADGDGKAAWVSIAAHMRTFHPIDDTSDGDVKAAAHARYVVNRWFLNAIVKGDYDDDLDETLTGPNDKSGDPTLKGRADYVGVNYYSDTLIGSSASQGVLLAAPLGFTILQDHLPTGRPRTDFAWDIYPEGFGTVLDEAATYALPIHVTENGIADHADVLRPRFLAEHLFQLGLAVQRGADVRGYFHWSLVDNFEWANGFCPKFGLHSVDPTTGARTPRGSATLYTSIIEAGKLTRAQVDAQPAYVDPVYCN